MTYQLTIRARRPAGLVGRFDELDIVFGPEHEPLPGDPRVECDRRPFVTSLDCHAVSWRAIRRRIKDPCCSGMLGEGYGVITEENVVDRHAELRGKRIEGTNGRLNLSRLDL